jgi:farnesyl diphosphate synthase
MVGGQMFDIAAERATTPLTTSEIARLQAMKTGALLKFSVEAGAVVSRAPAGPRAALAAYGEALGSAFQIADDILDAEGATEDLGKRAGKDAGRNKATFVGVHGLMEAKRLRDECVERALAALDAAGLGERADVLRMAARFVAERRS